MALLVSFVKPRPVTPAADKSFVKLMCCVALAKIMTTRIESPFEPRLYVFQIHFISLKYGYVLL